MALQIASVITQTEQPWQQTQLQDPDRIVLFMQQIVSGKPIAGILTEDDGRELARFHHSVTDPASTLNRWSKDEKTGLWVIACDVVPVRTRGVWLGTPVIAGVVHGWPIFKRMLAQIARFNALGMDGQLSFFRQHCGSTAVPSTLE